MSSPYCNVLQRVHFFSLVPTRYCSALSSSRLRDFSQSFNSSLPERTSGPSLYETFVVKAHSTARKLSAAAPENSGKTLNFKRGSLKRAGFSSFGKSSSETEVRNDSFYRRGPVVEENDEKTENKYVGRSTRSPGGSRLLSISKFSANGGALMVKNKDERKIGKGDVGNESKNEGSKKRKSDSPEVLLKVALDMCSKKGDVIGAINLYDMARRDGVKMSQHHYSVLLYLCSSAAVGVVQPGKSGSGSRTLNALETSSELVDVELCQLTEENISIENVPSEPVLTSDELHKENVIFYQEKSSGTPSEKNLTDFPRIRMKRNHQLAREEEGALSTVEEEREVKQIRVSEDVKKYALERGFEIYECMNRDKVPVNEATLTAVARMAMSVGNGDMSFAMVKKMKPLGINPRLRSYSPALTVFCNNGDVKNAFAVEKHMVDHGVYPEEPELEALLRLSIGAGESDKVYYLLHKLRTSVRRVSIPTARLVISWFRRKEAPRLGKRRLSPSVIDEAIKNNGGGWHGLGWLGKGKWNVSTTTVDADGICRSCRKRLAIIDLDSIETEKFAESVACLAMRREKQSSFQMFQKWLDNHGPFEAVVDGANVGLFGQNRFVPSKVKYLVNGIRQKLQLKKWPLIVLHHKRLTGGQMEKPVYRALFESWKNHHALFATPTGSNDDWYWLYAAIKYKCLIVTNDEMRDHTFQLLGNNFFHKWKERHQVRFSFSDNGPEFHMPPAYSTIIQESEEGHWHVPVISHHSDESDRTIWLCITRVS